MPCGRVTLQPGSMTMTTGNILGVDNEGRVNLELQATARIVADLSLHEALLAIRGQRNRPRQRIPGAITAT